MKLDLFGLDGLPVTGGSVPKHRCIKQRLRGDGWGRALIGPRKPLNDLATESDPVFMVPAMAAAVAAAL